MSQSFYPYIQTLHDFDESVSDYAIQPVSEDETKVPAEENPILAFGPLGRINIFIGATNAGKSRFLRALAKREQYQFYDSAESYQAVSDLLACTKWLGESEENVEFNISQQNHQMTDGSPVVLHHLPRWAKECLKGVQTSQNYSVRFDSEFFAQLKPFFENIVANRITNSNFKLKEVGADAEELQVAIWARNLIRGEEEAQQRDQVKKATIAVQYSQHLESLKVRNHEHLSFDIEKISVSWREKFVRMWEAFE